ncbi:MAG TPA: site-2 protease family protein [Cyclobacteriaceae bacterium]|nr:site-2 protease family protein [Cyclobacteriaceae bacterium]
MNTSKRRIFIHILLFVLTFVTTTLAGTEWAYSKSIFFSESYTWSDFLLGLQFSVPFLLILTVHEFGHYFTAMSHRVRASLPYFIPIPPLLTIGTLGAIIRIRDRVYSNIQHFDIGLAGPLAGFVIAIGVLVYGFRTLPPPEHIYTFHPEYEQYGPDYHQHVYTDEYIREHHQIDLVFGTNLMFMFFEKYVAEPGYAPNPRELMHYPILFAGFIALFFTSLNLLPIGQLDGGHVIYGLFGRRGHRVIAITFFIGLLMYSGLGYISLPQDRDQLWSVVPIGVLFYFFCLRGLGWSFTDTLMYAVVMVAVLLALAWLFPNLKGFSGWLVFGFLVGRVFGIYHPPSEIEVPLNPTRILLGWICLLIFIVSFSPVPLSVRELPPLPEAVP